MYPQRPTRAYKVGYGWSAIALPVVIGAVLIFALMPDTVLNWMPSVHVIPHRASSPCVLLVGGERAQRDAMASAAEARGMQTRFGADSAGAIQSLRSEPCGVKVAAVDSGVSNQSWLFQELRTGYPTATIAVFSSQMAPGKMVDLLSKAEPAKAASKTGQN